MVVKAKKSTFDFNQFIENLLTRFKHAQFTQKKQLAFLEDLYVLINDGIPANRAIEMMSQVTTGVTREVALTLAERISQGQPLAEGMKDWFAVNVVEIIRVGEAGGALAQTIRSAINMLSQQGIAMGAFVGAVAYPTVVIVMACGMIIYLQTSVFSQFEQIKPKSEWPAPGQQLIALADFITAWWWLTIIGIVAFVMALRFTFSNYAGELRQQLDRFPPFSLYRRLAAARMLETLGLLVSNGVVFKSAIKVMQHQANPYMQFHLHQMESLLARGKSNIGDVLDTGLIDTQSLMRLRVMAEVKGFEHGLVRMGVRGTEEATNTLKTIAKVIGTIMLIVGAIMIIMIIRGIFMTAMSMAS